MPGSFSVGESLVGDGDEVAHIDLLFGPAQAGVARAVVDSVRDGVIPQEQVDDLCVVVGVFIHWDASDDKKIFDWNYQATKESIARALGGEPGVQKVIDAAATARHPFAGGAEEAPGGT